MCFVCICRQAIVDGVYPPLDTPLGVLYDELKYFDMYLCVLFNDMYIILYNINTYSKQLLMHFNMLRCAIKKKKKKKNVLGRYIHLVAREQKSTNSECTHESNN